MWVPRGAVERLLPFFLHAGNEEKQDSEGSPQGQEPEESPGIPAQPLLPARAPRATPLNILLLLCASSFASGNTEPSCLTLQLQPQPCLRLGTSRGAGGRSEGSNETGNTPAPPSLPKARPRRSHSPARTVRTGRVTPRPPPRGGGGWRPAAPPAPAGGGGSGGARAPRGACSPRRSGTR